jgi:hypothetical protein
VGNEGFDNVIRTEGGVLRREIDLTCLVHKVVSCRVCLLPIDSGSVEFSLFRFSPFS